MRIKGIAILVLVCVAASVAHCISPPADASATKGAPGTFAAASIELKVSGLYVSFIGDAPAALIPIELPADLEDGGPKLAASHATQVTVTLIHGTEESAGSRVVTIAPVP